MKKITVFGLALVLVLATAGTAAADVDLSGSLKTDLIWDADAETLLDAETFNLVMERDFGFDADMTVDFQVDSYRTDQVVVPDEDGNMMIVNLPQTTRETDVEISEAYVNYYTTNIDWRLGKQEINWGSAYKLQPTDYFNPQDLTGLNPLDEKVGVKAVRGTYYAPRNIEITGVVTPFFDSHKMRDVDQVSRMQQMAGSINDSIDDMFKSALKRKLEDQYHENIYNETYENLNTYQINIGKVEDDVENSQAGAKFTKRRLGDFDVSLSAYHGRDKLPTVDEEKVAEESERLITEYLKEYGTDLENAEKDFAEYHADENLDFIIYPEANRLGFDLIGDLGEIGVWTEMTYSFYDDDQFDDRLEAALGADRRFGNDLYLVGQYYHRSGRIDAEDDIHLANIYFDKPVGDFHEIEMTTLYEFETETYFLEPQFNYSLADSTVLEIGATYADSDGDQTGMLDSLAEERIYTRLKVDF